MTSLALLGPERHVLVVGHRDDLDHAPPAERRRPHPGPAADEPAPVLRPAKRPLEARRGHLEHVARADHGPGFQESLEGPADPRAVVGRHTLAGSAVRAVHPHLQDGALDRSGSSEVHQLETEGVEVVANRDGAARQQTSEAEKKCGGTPPHRQSAHTSAPGTAREASAESGESQSSAPYARPATQSPAASRGTPPSGRPYPCEAR